ncbi:MAG: hypothetical protein ACKVUS_18915 [Saprospiraceae bacterium]
MVKLKSKSKPPKNSAHSSFAYDKFEREAIVSRGCYNMVTKQEALDYLAQKNNKPKEGTQSSKKSKNLSKNFNSLWMNLT